MARQPNAGGEVRFSTSKAQQEYLRHLSETTVLGRTPNEVAQHLFTEKLGEIIEKKHPFEIKR